jgi:hypothetical protein
MTARKAHIPVALTNTSAAQNIERAFLPIVRVVIAREPLFWFRPELGKCKGP